ncbi:MAG: DUF5668 domain-containing protein [Candidatus Bipolaricaulis sp.]|nr:DUF5668 domain-containing protein [Candidatus Bipolaricaulis sp.]MDD5645979.1 DUF5668 domain-containing protein [Candidatus Bipolaricaulis sp.]
MRRRGPLRGPFVLPLLLMAFGVVVLLVNFGVLDVREVWRIAARGWPVLIILLGVDLLLSRASIGQAFGILVLGCVIAAAAGSVLHVAAPSGWIVETLQINEPLPTASTAEISASCADCTMVVSGGGDRLVEGSVEVRRLDRLVRTSALAGSTFRLELRSEPRWPFSLRSIRGRPMWELRVAGDRAMTLSLSAARCDVNLDRTSVGTLSVRADDASVRLSSATPCTVYAAADALRLTVPAGVRLVVEGLDDVAEVVIPDGYRQADGSVASPGASSVTAQVVVLPGAERVEIRTQDAAGDPTS